MGKRATDLFSDSELSRWVAAYLATIVGNQDVKVGEVKFLLMDDFPETMPPDEIDRRLVSLVGGLSSAKEGRMAMQGIVAEMIEELTERLDLVKAREGRDRALAADAAMFDASAEGARRLRYEMSHERVLRASLRELRAIQAARPSQPAGASTAAEPSQSGLPTATLSKATAKRRPIAPTEPNAIAPTEPKPDAPTEARLDAPTEPNAVAPTEPNAVAPTEPNATAPTEPKPVEPRTELPVREAVTDRPVKGAQGSRVNSPEESPEMSVAMKAYFANQPLREEREAWEARREASRKAGGSGATSVEPFEEPYPGFDPNAKKLWHAFGDPELDLG